MKKSGFLFKITLLFVLLSFFSSCDKENQVLQIQDQQIRQQAATEEEVSVNMVDLTYSFAELEEGDDNDENTEATLFPRRKRCFKFVYPIDIVFPDSSIVTVENGREFRDTVKAWFKDNPDAAGRPEIVFPVDVILKNGKTVTLHSQLELKKLIRKCKKIFKHHRRFKRCFKPVFPLTLKYPGGKTKEIYSAKELKKALSKWKHQHPFAKKHPVIEFPFDVKLLNGKIITIHNVDELKKLLLKCWKHNKNRKHGAG